MSKITIEDLTDRLLDGDAQELLNELFTEDELQNLDSVKQELGLCINWKILIENMYQMMVDKMDTLVFLGTEKESPQVVNRNPYEALFKFDQMRINGPDKKSQKARKYVLLLIMKKLLGALKTRMKKELNGFDYIDEEDAGELREIVHYGRNEPDEEEMDLVTSLNEESDQEITAVINRRRNCVHHHMTVKQVPSTKTTSRMDELHTFCRDCKKLLEVQQLGTRTTGKRTRDRAKPRGCQHRNGHWKDGEEGKTAICTSCKKVVPNPEKFEWLKAGLEPVGDDPSKDEIQSFVVEELEEMEA